jgi:hypothetical protein
LALANDRCSPAVVSGHRLPNYLYGYLEAIGAKTLIVEPNYTDGDYLDDFASYYVRCFQRYERRCKRIHAFSSKLSNDDLLQAIESPDSSPAVKLLTGPYLGFIVARPLPDAIVGKTVLKTYPDDGGRRKYRCLRSYDANLYGIDLKVDSLAFQEQDTVLAACATVALWCCFHKTTELFGTAIPRPATITQSANQVVHQSRPIPSHGLIVEQLCNAIRHVGLEPEVIQVKPSTPLVSLIYAHVAMGLPVLLGMKIEGRGRHAVAVTGYSIKGKRFLSQEVSPGETSIPMTGLRIDEFYVHDDQIGPFSRLRILLGSASSPISLEGSWKEPSTGKLLKMTPEVLIVPVYNKIRVTYLDVIQWIELLNPLIEIALNHKQLEWDVTLSTVNNLKREVKNAANYCPDRKDFLIEPQPRFIWRAILNNNGSRSFEVLADATDMARSLPLYRVNWFDDKLKLQLRALLTNSFLEATLKDLLTDPFYEFLKAATE